MIADARHASRRRFANSYGSTWTQPLPSLLKWRLVRTWDRRRGSSALPPRVENDGTPLREEGAHLTWIGHATFVLRLGGVTVATDPVWSERVVFFKRLRPPGVGLDDLRAIDVVTVSHCHYDHLDLASLRALHERFRPLFIVPLRVGRFLRAAGIEHVVELDWWQSRRVGRLEVVLVPAHHWSQRGAFDKNRTLWGGFVYSAAEGTAYHAGDTAFEPRMFADIFARFPRIDWAMLPVGAYEPEWFLGTQHMNPEDAGRAFEVLGARHFIAMHYGTFELTDEPRGEPLERIRAWFDAWHPSFGQLCAPAIGETLRLADL